jgi:hypothetical protein
MQGCQMSKCPTREMVWKVCLHRLEVSKIKIIAWCETTDLSWQFNEAQYCEGELLWSQLWSHRNRQIQFQQTACRRKLTAAVRRLTLGRPYNSVAGLFRRLVQLALLLELVEVVEVAARVGVAELPATLHCFCLIENPAAKVIKRFLFLTYKWADCPCQSCPV